LAQLPALEFVKQYLTVGQDPKSNYDLSLLKPVLPRVTSPKQALDWLALQAPSVVRDGKFYIYNQEFYQKILYFLYQLSREITGQETKMIIPDRIADWYRYSDDFKGFPSNTVFVDLQSFEEWLDYQDQTERSVYLSQRLEWNDNHRQQPFFYMSPSNQIIMIVNVANADRRRALTISHSWYTSGINPGFYAPLMEEADLKLGYTIYTLDINHHLTKYGRHQGPLSILRYAPNNYAAILPLTD